MEDKNAQEQAEREAKRIAGIKATRAKRGDKISGHNKQIKSLDKQIELAEKEAEKLKALKQNRVDDFDNLIEKNTKRLEELQGQKAGHIEKRDGLIEVAQKNSKKGGNMFSDNKDIKDSKNTSPKTEAASSTSASSEANIKTDNNTKAESVKAEAPKAGEPVAKTETSKPDVWKDAREGKLFAEHGTEHVETIEKHKENLKTLGEAATDEIKKTTNENIANAEKELAKVRGEKFQNLKLGDKIKANLGGNFGKEVSNGAKVFKGAGSVIGLGAMIDGTKRLIAPERDEKTGERTGSAWAAVGEIGAGALGTYALLRGGANKAMGIPHGA